MSRLVAAEQLEAIEFNLTRARKLKLTWEIKNAKTEIPMEVKKSDIHYLFTPAHIFKRKL